MTSVAEPSDEDLKVTPPKKWATGLPAVAHAMQYSLEQTSPRRTALALLNINQANGIDSPGCAWPEPQPGQQHFNAAPVPRRPPWFRGFDYFCRGIYHYASIAYSRSNDQ